MSDELKPQSIDSPEFRELLLRLKGRAVLGNQSMVLEAETALIAHIDAWGARLAGVPDGWKLVPVTPTRQMLNAAYEASEAGCYFSGIYRDMIAAAPTPKEDACGS
jgi:hypothetical protein